MASIPDQIPIPVFQPANGSLPETYLTTMLFRECTIADIPQVQVVRNSVKENPLSDPALVPDSDVEDYIINRGRGWVCEIDDIIVGFSIVSVSDKNVWALFILPGYEKRGVGRRLHDEMMNWYFDQTDATIWLSTAPGTRAERFYRKAGWTEVGMHGKGEIKFEMKAGEWSKQQS
jgi:GNAT superfamily N-acetyltransferase